MIHPTAIVDPGTALGAGAVIGAFVIVGEQPATPHEPSEIGASAHIRSHTVIYAGNHIGDRFTTGHGVTVREANRIGVDVAIGSRTSVEHHVEVGDRVRIHSGAFVAEHSRLEPDSWVGPHVVLTNVPHPTCPEAKRCLRGPTIGRGAIIGAHAVVLPWLTVGEHALVGAGAVVVDDVEPGTVVVGNPARVVGSVEDITCPVDLIERPYGNPFE